jgi:hypothetical protein
MPECLMLAYSEQVPRLQARRQLDAADVALHARMATSSHAGSESWQQWFAAMTRQAQHIVRDDVITLNGVVVGVERLARGLRRVFGGGVDRERRPDDE